MAGFRVYQWFRQELRTSPHLKARLKSHGAAAMVLILAFALIGILGFMAAGERFVDATLNSAMLLAGMGPVGAEDLGDGGKLFAAGFALIAGLVFLLATGLLLTPALHHLLQHFRFEDQDKGILSANSTA